MASEHQIRLYELLEHAASWPPAELVRRARQACATGPVSAQELLAALEAVERSPEFMEQSVWAGGPESFPCDVEVGDVVGRFRLVRSLGEGGMGRVFLAEQEEPKRRVALKLVRGDLDTSSTRRLFRTEQDALARLKHPNVAQLYEADVTAGGQPYFAMEWVEGLPLDRYVGDPRNADRLGLDERLRIFADVCDAIQHAHEKQILHRDLKPSNVLVAEVGGRPVVKVIDFGIAQALDRPWAVQAGAAPGRIYGTPEYLSPEAFDGDVDSRSDVYGLGVLLYQLLTGCRPFAGFDGDLLELKRAITRGDSPPPSRAARAASGTVGDRRSERWRRRLRGDLDAIVAKAMHVDRERRYVSAADLAADVWRFLAARPVSARRASAWHRARLLARRRRGAVLASALLVVSLLAGGIGTTLGMVRARAEAEAARKALAESEALSDMLTQIFDVSDPGRARSEHISVREVLDEGARRLREGFVDQPLLRARFARTVGDLYAKLGFFPEAEPLLRMSMDLYEQHSGPDHPEVAATAHSLGVMKTKAGDLPAGKSYFESALAIQQADPRADPSAVALTRYHLGLLAYRMRDIEHAEVYFKAACPAWRGIEGLEEMWARCLEAFGVLRTEQGRRDEATDLLRRSLELRRRVLGDDHLHVAASLDSLCFHHRNAMQLAEAAAACREALAIRRRVVGEKHLDYGRSLSELARVHQYQGEVEEARRLLGEALTIAESQEDPNHFRHSAWLTQMAWIAWLGGRYDEAAELYRRVFEIRTELFGAEHKMVSLVRVGLGITLWKQGDLAAAEAELLEARELMTAHFGDQDRQTAWVYWALAGLYRDRDDRARNDLEHAGRLYEKALVIRRAAYPEGHPVRQITEADHADYLRKIEPAEAGG